MSRVKVMETIERAITPAWRGGTTYTHIVININEGHAIKIEHNITPAQFRTLLNEGGWFKGTRKREESNNWPYMFRVKE
jgi:hypothetical protein